MGWPQAGFILFAFAAPSACIGVAYSIGMAGFIGGSLLCVVVTLASIGGSLMLLRMRLLLPGCHTFGDLGLRVLGGPGKVWGDVIQLGNFVLFLPVALLLCASALQGVVDIPAFKGCSDYYILTVAALCLATTQMRTLRNTQLLSFVSLVCVFAIAALQIIAAFKYQVEGKVEARMFGNPERAWATRLTEALLGTTTAAWAFVPAFLTVELATVMAQPERFVWSLALSGVLNVTVFVGVGVTVVARWGYDVEDPITLTKVAAWSPGNGLNRTLSTCLLVGNFVSYMLDSVPLARYCQKAWAPQFADTWSLGDIARYLLYSLPTFFFGLVMSMAVPNLFVLLAFTTALTVPMVTQIYPAVLYWKLFSGGGRRLPQENCDERAAEGMEPWEKCGVLAVLLVGCASFAVCLVAAVGKVAISQLRGPSQIGCEGWIIWRG